MTVISKSDLQYEYTWTTDKGDNPKYVGKLDRDKVDRDEGYEVLDFLNAISSSKHYALHAEHLIKTKLPGAIQKRDEIQKWLKDNWTK